MFTRDEIIVISPNKHESGGQYIRTFVNWRDLACASLNRLTPEQVVEVSNEVLAARQSEIANRPLRTS